MAGIPEPAEINRAKGSDPSQAKRRATVAIGCALIGLGFLSGLTHGLSSPFIPIGCMALGIPLAAEVVRSRSPYLRRFVSLLVPFCTGFALGMKSPSFFGGDLTTFLVLLSDTWPMFLMLAAVLLPFSRTRLAAHLLAASTLIFIVAIMAGVGITHYHQTKNHDDQRIPREPAGGSVGRS